MQGVTRLLLTAFGVADNSDLQVLDLLLIADSQSDEGVLFDINNDGVLIGDASEALFREMANEVFTGINEQ